MLAMPLYSGSSSTRMVSLLDCLTPTTTLTSVNLPIDIAWNLTEVESTATPLWELQISYWASFIQTKPLVLQTEIIATDCDNHMKHFVNTPCGQNTDLLEVKPGDTNSTEITVLSCKYLDSFFMFVPCINSSKTLFYYSKLMHTIIKS